MLFTRILLLFQLLLASFGSLSAQYSPERYPIVPKPVEVHAEEGYFEINSKTKITYTSAVGKPSADILQQTWKDIYGLKLKIQTNNESHKNNIQFDIKKAEGENEAYSLLITPTGIHIAADNPKGAFYAIQTLLQLYHGAKSRSTDADYVRIPSVRIVDHPALGYRGLLLDVARYYMPVDAIKKYIDLMSYYKMNNLHLHLTDDQGWRIEIKKYPKLHKIGSKRKETLANHHHTKVDPVKIYDGIPHEGYYSQKELKDLVKYADSRHVNIIPEIEMPGHSQAALAAYPQLGCKDSVYEVSTTWGIHKEILCPSEYTFSFLEDVLTEVMEVFPSRYIHIGGDECPQDRWKESGFVQQLIRDKGLKDEHGLQNYFMQRTTKFLSSHGRQALAWYWESADHMANEEKPIILSWQGEEAGIAAVRRRDYTIMTPHLYTYLDYYQTEKGRQAEPLSIAGFLPLEKVYSYKPFPQEVSGMAGKYILGMQACLWTEYVKEEKIADYKLFPRLCAIAEISWLNNTKEKDYKDFLDRLKINVKYLQDQGVNYRKEYFEN